MPLAWQHGWKGQGQGQVFLGEDPPPPPPRHCLFPELLQCSVWMERLVGRGPPPATSVFLFCAQQCLISPAHAEGYDSEGARLASASHACRRGGCATTPLCFKTLCQHSKSESRSLKKLGGEVIPSRCCTDSDFSAAKTMVSWETINHLH